MVAEGYSDMLRAQGYRLSASTLLNLYAVSDETVLDVSNQLGIDMDWKVSIDERQEMAADLANKMAVAGPEVQLHQHCRTAILLGQHGDTGPEGIDLKDTDIGGWLEYWLE